jgi:hypothetical protein
LGEKTVVVCGSIRLGLIAAFAVGGVDSGTEAEAKMRSRRGTPVGAKEELEGTGFGASDCEMKVPP